MEQETTSGVSRFPSTGLEIYAGVTVDVAPSGAWIVRAGDRAFSLEAAGDFFRVWALLEHPFDDVKARLDGLATSSGASTPFPMWKLVTSAVE